MEHRRIRIVCFPANISKVILQRDRSFLGGVNAEKESRLSPTWPLAPVAPEAKRLIDIKMLIANVKPLDTSETPTFLTDELAPCAGLTYLPTD